MDAHQQVQSRIASIDRQLGDLRDAWEFACSSDVDYRLVEAKMDALRQERTALCEIKGDL